MFFHFSKNEYSPLRLFASSPLRLCSTLAIASAALFAGAPGRAQVIFFDNFDSNTPALNGVPTGWTIGNGGTVDIIGTCSGITSFDFFPGNGCYIDLDGSTFTPGKLKKSFSLAAGYTYILDFDLGSTQNNVVRVDFGTSTSTISLVPGPITPRSSLTFTPTTSGAYDLTFLDQGADNNGGFLDNVKITQTPAPLPILGVAAAFGASRRLRARLRKAQH